MIHRTRFLDFILADPKYSQSRNRYVSLDAEGSGASDQFEFMVKVLAPSVEQASPYDVATRKFGATDGLREYSSEHVILCGPPGSGKTATLQRLLLEMAARAQTDSTAPIPALVELKHDESLTNLIGIFLAEHGEPATADYVETMLSTGQLFLILDGLNELPLESRRSELSLFRSKYRRTTPMVFSKRDTGPGGDLRIEKKLLLLPLTGAQVRSYVRAHVNDRPERLLTLLKGPIRDLAATPLFLSMLCAIYDTRKDIPSHLADVFRGFVEEIYCRAFKQDAPVGPEIRSLWNGVLARLAFEMTLGYSRADLQLTASRKNAELSIARYLKSQHSEAHLPDRSMILEALVNHHLVRLSIGGAVEFPHQMIQEYFAAEYLLGELTHISDVALKQDYLNCVKWTEPLAMALQLTEDLKQVERIIRLAIDVDLALAARLAGAARAPFQSQAIDFIGRLRLPHRAKLLLFGKTSSKAVLVPLIDALSHENPQIGITAAKGLARIKASEAIDSLINALGGTDPQLPKDAAAALGSIGSDEAVDPLYNLMHSQDVWFRIYAAWTLGAIGSELAISRLIEGLHEKEGDVRAAATKGLAVAGSDRAVGALVVALEDGEEWVRWSATEALVSIGTENVAEEFIRVLEHGTRNARDCAAKGLGRMAVSKATERLVEHFLADEDTEVRWNSGVALGKIGNEEAMDCLSKAVESKSTNMRWIAAFALAHAGDQRGVSVLIEAARHDDSDIRSKAASALGQIPSDMVRKLLIKLLLFDNATGVRATAARALAQMGGKTTQKALISALERGNRDVRAAAADALGTVGDDGAVGPLLKALGDRIHDWVPQVYAAQALAKIGNPDAIVPLLKIIENEKGAFGFPWWATTALSELGDYSVIARLWKLTLATGEELLLDCIADIQRRLGFYNHELLPVEGTFHALHLSDLHFATIEDAEEWYGQLFLDLTKGLKLPILNCLVLSGDIGTLSEPKEYDAAELFLRKLMKDFKLGPDDVVMVPGNHDLNWQISKRAVESGASGLPEPAMYEKRFFFFGRLLKKITGKEFPMKKEDQWTLKAFQSHRLLFLGLNSCWELDHLNTTRASINGVACVNALRKIQDRHDGYIKIAVWHHPLDSPDEDRIKDTGFMELLSKSGFKLALHGHIHRAENRSFRPDRSPEGSHISIIAAGTFGAATRELFPAYPWQYNVLRIERNQVQVETRKRENSHGSWKPDARWQEDEESPILPNYKIEM